LLLSTLAFVSFIVINLLVDILYGAIDPRVRNV
jgi:oligopeptide transport system permease protein